MDGLTPGMLVVMRYIVLVGVVLVSGTVNENSTSACPGLCYCTQGEPPNTGLVVKCMSASLIRVPDALPSDVERLYLSDNLIQEINPTVFSLISKTSKNTFPSQDRFTNTVTDKFRYLTFLDVSHNRLTSLPSNLPQTLINLNLGENLIAQLETEKLYKLHLLEELHLNHNVIQELHRHMFYYKPCEQCESFLSRLRKLALNGNVIQQIQGGAFHGLVHLQALTLADNEITELLSRHFEGLEELQFLDLSNNKINTIWSEAFAGLPNLKYLYLKGNFMKGIPAKLPLLKWFDVSWNQIESLDEQAVSRTLSHIEIVNLANNPLHCNKQLDWLICLMKDKIPLIKQIKGPLTKYMPSCASPQEVAGELWDTLSERRVACHRESKTSTDGKFHMNENTLQYESYHKDFVHKLKILRSESTPFSITLYWDLLDKQMQEETIIVYYYTKDQIKGTSAYVEVPCTKFQHTFDMLQPQSLYTLCLAPTRMGRSHSAYPNHCREVMTFSLPYEEQEKSTITSLLIVVAACIFFWLGLLCYRFLVRR